MVPTYMMLTSTSGQTITQNTESGKYLMPFFLISSLPTLAAVGALLRHIMWKINAGKIVENQISINRKYLHAVAMLCPCSSHFFLFFFFWVDAV